MAEGAPKQESEPKPTRRSFLAGAGAVVAVGLGTNEAAAKRVPEKPRAPEAAKIPLSPELLKEYTFLSAEKHPQTLDSTAIAGRRWAGLFADYAGTDPTKPLPQTYEADFKYQLAHLWQKKLHLADGQAPTQAYFEKNKELFDLAERLYRTYDKERSRREPLEQYIEEAEHTVGIAGATIAERWGEIGKKRNMSAAELQFAMEMEKNISGRVLLSYALTELMPSEDGAANARMLDFLLQSAGADFVESIPALGDDLASFGPYQFTDSALKGVDAGSGGAKLSRQFGIPIPQSAAEVSGSLHHTTAYALAVEACLQVAKRVAAKIPEHILHTFVANLENVIAFVSVAHHTPEGAYAALKAYLEVKAAEGKRSLLHKVVSAKPKSFAESIKNESLAQYARKTIANYRALGHAPQIASAEKKI